MAATVLQASMASAALHAPRLPSSLPLRHLPFLSSPAPALLPFPNVANFAAFGFLATTALASPASAVEIHAASSLLDQVLALTAQEPKNALSVPTWTIHVASVVEWVVAMSLVWKYGNKPGNAAWKGLSWGMVPLLGGALCACTWHFFYNAESLEVGLLIWTVLTHLKLEQAVKIFKSDSHKSYMFCKVLVAVQAALTMIGNCTMWLAAFRIYRSTQDSSRAS